MRVTFLISALTLFSLVSGPISPLCADDEVEDIRRSQQIATEKLEAEIHSALDEAAKLASITPRLAVRILEDLEVRLLIDRNLSSKRRVEVKETVARRLREYRQKAGMEPSPVRKRPYFPRELLDLRASGASEKEGRPYDAMIERCEEIRKALEKLRGALLHVECQ